MFLDQADAFGETLVVDIADDGAVYLRIQKERRQVGAGDASTSDETHANPVARGRGGKGPDDSRGSAQRGGGTAKERSAGCVGHGRLVLTFTAEFITGLRLRLAPRRMYARPAIP
jgi:hypothetical protein